MKLKISSTNFCYHDSIPDKLVNVLEKLRANGTEIKVFYSENNINLDSSEYIPNLHFPPRIGYIMQGSGNSFNGPINAGLGNKDFYSRRNDIGMIAFGIREENIVKIQNAKTKKIYYLHPKVKNITPADFKIIQLKKGDRGYWPPFLTSVIEFKEKYYNTFSVKTAALMLKRLW